MCAGFIGKSESRATAMMPLSADVVVMLFIGGSPRSVSGSSRSLKSNLGHGSVWDFFKSSWEKFLASARNDQDTGAVISNQVRDLWLKEPLSNALTWLFSPVDTPAGHH
jgi:hypothetical protein